MECDLPSIVDESKPNLDEEQPGEVDKKLNDTNDVNENQDQSSQFKSPRAKKFKSSAGPPSKSALTVTRQDMVVNSNDLISQYSYDENNNEWFEFTLTLKLEKAITRINIDSLLDGFIEKVKYLEPFPGITE